MYTMRTQSTMAIAWLVNFVLDHSSYGRVTKKDGCQLETYENGSMAHVYDM